MTSARAARSCATPRGSSRCSPNLLGNAIKFTPEGGVVSLYVDDANDGKGLRFAVRDTGSGIPPEDIEAIFTKFWTGARRSGGTGLGLWIACAILEAHGAHLSVESRVGEGATFSFTLPAQPSSGSDS